MENILEYLFYSLVIVVVLKLLCYQKKKIRLDSYKGLPLVGEYKGFYIYAIGPVHEISDEKLEMDDGAIIQIWKTKNGEQLHFRKGNSWRYGLDKLNHEKSNLYVLDGCGNQFFP